MQQAIAGEAAEAAMRGGVTGGLHCGQARGHPGNSSLAGGGKVPAADDTGDGPERAEHRSALLTCREEEACNMRVGGPQ